MTTTRPSLPIVYQTVGENGVPVAALILSESPESPVPPAETAAAIARFAPGLRILHVPRLAGPEAWRRVPLYAELIPGV